MRFWREKDTADEKNEGFMGNCSGNCLSSTACGKKEEYVAAPESKVSVEMAPVQVTTAPETEHETKEETEETVEERKRIAVRWKDQKLSDRRDGGCGEGRPPSGGCDDE